MQKLLQDVNIGINLKRLRKINHFSQDDVAKKLQLLGRNISTSRYGHLEQGIGNIYVSDLIRLSKIFNVDFNEFFLDLELPDEGISD